MRKRQAFTLVELLVVVGIITLLVGILVPSLGKARFTARKATCAANMKGVVQGMAQWASENNGRFPTARFRDTSHFDTIGAYITTASTDTTTKNSNSRNLFLGVLNANYQAAALVCPNTGDKPTAMMVGGLRAHDFNVGNGANYRNTLSYSYHLQFSTRGTTPGFPVGMHSETGMAVLADRNPAITYPGTAVDTGCRGTINAAAISTNSPNHDAQGQNVAYVDSHVTWQTGANVGANGDNIWSVQQSSGTPTIAAGSLPFSDSDSFLVP